MQVDLVAKITQNVFAMALILMKKLKVWRVGALREQKRESILDPVRR